MITRLKGYKKVFLGGCKGIGLSPRGTNDPHVCFTVLAEDEGNWVASTNSTSSFWLPELQRVLKEATEWIEKNCVPDVVKKKGWPKGVQYGWKFRK